MLLTLSLGAFDGVEHDRLPGLMPLLREAGFRHLEAVDRAGFDDNAAVLDELCKAAKAYGIEIPNWHLTQHAPFQDTESASKEAIQYMKGSMERGYRLGSQNHVLHWFHRFRDRNYDALWREIVDEWAQHARHLGIRLLMETVPDKPTNPRYVPSSEIIEFVQDYPPEVMAVCVDVNHSNLVEKLPDVVHSARDRLVSLHVSDNDGCAEQHWLPGQGVLDFPELFESLEAIQFDGLFVLEIGKWCEREDELPALTRLYEFEKCLIETHHPHSDTPPLRSA